MNTKVKKYQEILNQEYMNNHKEETMGLLSEHITLMNPITNSDIIAFVYQEMLEIIEKIKEMQFDISEDEKLLDNPDIYYSELCEIRSDITNGYRNLRRLKIRLSNLEVFFNELNIGEEYGKCL